MTDEEKKMSKDPAVIKALEMFENHRRRCQDRREKREKRNKKPDD